MLERHAVGVVILAALLPMTFVSAAADMKYPDMQSQWRNPTAGRGGNPWDPNKPMGLGQQAPLTPEYQATFEASLKAQKEGSQGNSRGSTCEIAGMPKMMNFSEPMEIVIRPNIFYFIPVQVPTRRIYTDGRAFPKDAPPTLGGYSIGRWIDEDGDGRYDVLEAETRHFKGPRVFESTGLPLHDDNQTVVKERIYLRVRKPIWIEKNCHESNPHLRIGDEEYFLSADGKLMPVSKGQRPPDLRYFEQTAR